LLDGEFGDEQVRLFAVQRISTLEDTFWILFIPQLVVALKYEPQHKSALSELMFERALMNKRVIGHAFYWSIYGALHDIKCFERYYVIQERLIMVLGQYKYDLYR